MDFCTCLGKGVVDHNNDNSENSAPRCLSRSPSPSPFAPGVPVLRSAAASTSIVVANWKSLTSQESVAKLLKVVNRHSFMQPVRCVLVPPPLYLPMIQKSLINPKCVVAAANVTPTLHPFTGEISFPQLTAFSIIWILLGHPERRLYFNETNETIAQNVVDALKLGFIVIVCVGETQEEREKEKTMEVITAQMTLLIEKIDGAAASGSSWLTPENTNEGKTVDEIVSSLWSSVVIAYAPLWAVGGDHAATPQQAQEVHHHIRECLSQVLAPELVANVRILYGGSVNATNASELYDQEDVNGFLVGRASLTEELLAVVEATKKRKVKVHITAPSPSSPTLPEEEQQVQTK